MFGRRPLPYTGSEEAVKHAGPIGPLGPMRGFFPALLWDAQGGRRDGTIGTAGEPVTTSLYLAATLLLALVTALLAVVASRPARERWRDPRDWEEALNQRPAVDWDALVRLVPVRPWIPRHSSPRSPA